MKRFFSLHTFLLAALISGCASSGGVDLPKGTSKGFSSMRFVQARKTAPPDFIDNSALVNSAIQDAIKGQFRANGLEVRGSDADLVVGPVLRRADEALYMAKNIGRNRVYYHDGRAPTLVGAPEVAKG